MADLELRIKDIIKSLYGLDFVPEFTPSPAGIEADYSTNAPLRLAKDLHQSPMAIGEQIRQKLEHDTSSDNLASFFLTPPGFLNFTFSDAYYHRQITSYATNFIKNISCDAYSGQTIVCEFSDPNPFKVLHVGHLYTSIVGDAISRLFEYAGARVIRANFGGDVGLHVAKTLYALRNIKREGTELTIEDIAVAYIEGTRLYDADEQAREAIDHLNQDIYTINRDDIHGTPLADLYWLGRELSYDYFKHFYAGIGVKFDKYYPESTVAELGLATVKGQLKNGIYEMSNGAVIFPGERYGLHTRVFINQHGVPTYETKDVGLIFTKWQDYHFDRSVVITGSEQLDYMKVVLKSIEQYAPDLVAKTTHLTHGLVKLPGNVKMSSRKGNFLKAVDVLELVEHELAEQYHSYDRTVALAATKYAFLKYKMGGNIIFNPHESVEMTGNSGPYLLYSAVRAKKILAKASEKPASADSVHSSAFFDSTQSLPSASSTQSLPILLTPSERALACKLLEYRATLALAVSEMAPHRLATYLYDLAQDFSRFYEHCPVRGSENESERLDLTSIYLNVMTHGLGLLGITIPDEM